MVSAAGCSTTWEEEPAAHESWNMRRRSVVPAQYPRPRTLVEPTHDACLPDSVQRQEGGDVDWKDRLPEGIGDVHETKTGFEASISIPVDEDGFFGRECPECGRLFKMHFGQYEALPDDLELICPYCGDGASAATS
jgi:hypothetical protein